MRDKLRQALLRVSAECHRAARASSPMRSSAPKASVPSPALLLGGERWLLERGDSSAPEYIYASQSGLEWTRDHAKALRLSRREDADTLAWIVEDCTRVAEHIWTLSPTDKTP